MTEHTVQIKPRRINGTDYKDIEKNGWVWWVQSECYYCKEKMHDRNDTYFVLIILSTDSKIFYIHNINHIQNCAILTTTILHSTWINLSSYDFKIFLFYYALQIIVYSNESGIFLHVSKFQIIETAEFEIGI